MSKKDRNAISSLKVKRQMSNKTLAEIAEYVDVSEKTIKAIEENKLVPPMTIGMRISKFFGLKVEDLFHID